MKKKCSTFILYIEAVGVNGSASCNLKIPFLSQVRCRFESGTVSPFYYNDSVKNEKCFVLVVFYNFQFKRMCPIWDRLVHMREHSMGYTVLCACGSKPPLAQILFEANCILLFFNY